MLPSVQMHQASNFNGKMHELSVDTEKTDFVSLCP